MTDDRLSAWPHGRLLVISPHLDDAVFSCGRMIASASGTLVVTVFAGVPPSLALTDWDRDCGFASGEAAMHARRLEDRTALAILDARPLWLDFLDRRYRSGGAGPEVGAIEQALLAATRDFAPQSVIFPLGLFHSDHELAHEAALLALPQTGQMTWIAYADGRSRMMPRVAQERLRHLHGRGIETAALNVTPAPGAAERKADAAACYHSRWRGLGTALPPVIAELQRPEQYWHAWLG